MLQPSKASKDNKVSDDRRVENSKLAADVTGRDSDTLLLVGDVTFQNVVSLRGKGESIISRMSSRGIIDLTGLCSANTVTLSLVLSWLRFAKRSNVSLTISQSPGKLFDMARVSGLESVLPFQPVDR